MRRKWHWWLFALYIMAEFADQVTVPGAPWLAGVATFAPILLAILLAALIEVAVSRTEHLKETVGSAEGAASDLAARLDDVAALRSEVVAVKSDVDAVRKKMRQDDVLLHGKLMFFEKRYREAAELFEAVVREDPGGTRNRYWLGMALMRQKQPGRAVAHLQAAVDADPNEGEYVVALAEAEYHSRQFGPARRHLERAVELGVRNGEVARLMLAKVQMQSEDVDAALETVQAVVAVNPYGAQGQALLIEILVGQARYDEALEVCERALIVNPRNWTLYPLKAETLMLRAGEEDERAAVEVLKVARSGNKRDYNIYRVEGTWWVKRGLAGGSGDEAAECLRRGVAVYDEGLAVIPGANQAALHAAKVLPLLALGEPAAAEQAAEAAVRAYPAHVNNHLLLGFARVAGARWTGAVRAAHDAKGAGGRHGEILAGILELIGSMCAGEYVSDVKETTRVLADNVRQSPRFVAARREWPYCRGALVQRAGAEGDLLSLLDSYLAGGVDNVQFVDRVGRAAAA